MQKLPEAGDVTGLPTGLIQASRQLERHFLPNVVKTAKRVTSAKRNDTPSSGKYIKAV
ncbi:hypothetical protein [Lactococcus garvieae]|uniref:hypothetical protein n=1 Tax=Lactococcus garvieae TaxID=1363 RepID=UPI0015D87CE1|nr:hypothetical protein [Lactococcus garvieae]